MPKNYGDLEALIIGGTQLPLVEDLEAYSGQAPVWARNMLGDVVRFNPQDKVYDFPKASTDEALLIAA